MPTPISITSPGLPEFQAALKEYIKVSGKIPADVVARKGLDLRIKMFQGMRRRAYSRGRKGGVWRDQKRRFAAGKGVLVRDESKVKEGTDKNGKKLNRWQAAVAEEIARRERGIGVLGVTFLDRRWRRPRKGSYLSTNTSRSFGTMLLTQQTPTTFHMVATTPGVEEVATRYGITNTALAQATADIDTYLVRKANEAGQVFNRYKSTRK